MKKIILLLILFISVNYAYSQKLDVRILGEIGISTKNLIAPITESRLSHKNDQSLYNAKCVFSILDHQNIYIFRCAFLK